MLAKIYPDSASFFLHELVGLVRGVIGYKGTLSPSGLYSSLSPFRILVHYYTHGRNPDSQWKRYQLPLPGTSVCVPSQQLLVLLWLCSSLATPPTKGASVALFLTFSTTSASAMYRHVSLLRLPCFLCLFFSTNVSTPTTHISRKKNVSIGCLEVLPLNDFPPMQTVTLPIQFQFDRTFIANDWH